MSRAAAPKNEPVAAKRRQAPTSGPDGSSAGRTPAREAPVAAPAAGEPHSIDWELRLGFLIHDVSPMSAPSPGSTS